VGFSPHTLKTFHFFQAPFTPYLLPFSYFCTVKIDKHISDLLYRYDCVIVPELGGFVCNYSPAKIHPVQHSFTPPSKNIVFNSNLRNNDGLLANHISQEERTSFKEANVIIQRFVNTTNDDLASGKRVAIEEVGTLFLDVERNIQFEPDGGSNFLLDSFGLNAFHSPAVKREGISQRLEKEFKDRIVPKEKAKDIRRINVRRMVAAAILIPLVAAMIWIPLKTDLLKNMDLSSINPFAPRENPMYKPSGTTVPELTEKDLTDKTASSPGNTDATTIKLTDGSTRSIVVSVNDDNVTAPDTTAVAPVVTTTHVSSGNFYIIGGCFEVYDNATRFVQSLKEKGHNATILNEKLGRLSPVAYTDGFSSMEEALQELAKIHAEDPNAWILSR
jgi:hypothetical protein